MSGLYIHVPFCRSKCSYCDFYSVALPDLTDAYVNALLNEIILRKDELSDKKISTIYLGGGTPSLLKKEHLDLIFDCIYRNFEVDVDSEITLEANPDDLSREYLNILKNTPVNRLSIGIQSFNPDRLRMMRRRHSSNDGIRDVMLAAEVGFDNLSIDLIYGVDGMSLNDWRAELDKAFSLPVVHLSAYHLGIEEGTLLHKKLLKGEISKIDENSSFSQYLTLIEKSSESGFEQYEISNFAKDKKYSKHNSSYWNRSEYLGFGPSAHSLTGRTRSLNSSDVRKYITHSEYRKQISETEYLTDTDILNETIMLGLRTTKGINLADFLVNFGHEEYNHLLIRASSLKPENYQIQDDYFKLTDAGMFVSDGIISSLFKP